MSRREAILTALGIFAVALAVRFWFAAQIVYAKPEDTAYYVGVARNLLEGRGLISDALWSYQTPPLELGRDAFEVWMPLPTFLAAITMAVFGVSFTGAQVSSVIVGAMLPVLAWRLAADVADDRRFDAWRARTIAIGTGLTTAVYLPVLLFSALPDSTMPFAVLVLGACLLMTRILREPAAPARVDGRAIALGVVLGLGALTRNETAILALIWAVLVWFRTGWTLAERLRLIGIVALAAFVVFLPWIVRNLVVLGHPLPSQAAANALYLTGFDVFAWNDPPTLARYLAQGPLHLLELRVEGTAHNLFNVLLYLGLPISLIGLATLPWQGRDAATRPLVLISVVLFVFISLVFPAATQWGTFLHAAGPAHVLLVLSALLALDAAIARLGQRLGWTNPVAWLGPALGVFASLLFSAVLLAGFGASSRETATYYQELGRRMAAIGRPLDASAGPVISNFPIWVAEEFRIPALALPNEPPLDVLDLAASFEGTRLLILSDPGHPHWPADLDAGAPGSECFQELDLGVAPDATLATDPLAKTRVFVIACP